ncbi:hypothetical protein HWV07_19400 [Natronomonas salina]|uniref:hypothetical protein n=1 Tax=Natronomonas salina TaxID=1710540 RepID=UPI0015B5B7D0|nr:hypothetical protein [Natronomonas salina]QLD91092.1 hypothetical protein HWV07_19400 [Natronomonas salina]
MSTTPDPADETDQTTDGTAAISLDEFDENRQAGLLTMKALNRLGLHLPINEPVLRERTPGGDDYVVVVPLGPAIGSGGAKVACMMWGVEEVADDPISFTIDDRETDTWVEGFPAEELNRWVHPDVDAEYETYPVERTGENSFRLVASTAFFDSYDGEDAEQRYEPPADEPDGVVETPDTDLEPDADPMYY